MKYFLIGYNVICKIGEGSFSEVLKVKAFKTGKMFAAKRLKTVFKDELDLFFCVELAALRNLEYHPNVLGIVDVFCDPLPGQITLIFELMDMSLYDYMENSKKWLSESKVKCFLYQLVCGIQHLHSNGLFHRDIKPENILIKFNKKYQHGFRGKEVVQLADLGSVCNVYKSPPHSAYISTRWYRAPECLLSHGHYGAKMDIWSLGCVYYEMLTLSPLFPGDNELDQLNRIHDIVGSPSLAILSRFKHRNLTYNFPKRKPVGMYNLVPALSQDGVDLLSKCLIYLPEIRSDVHRLKEHSYFHDLRAKIMEFSSTPSLQQISKIKNVRTTNKTRLNVSKEGTTSCFFSNRNWRLKGCTSTSLDPSVFSVVNFNGKM